MRPSLRLAVAVLLVVAVVFALLAVSGVGRDATKDRTPGVTTIILKDTIDPATTADRAP